MTRIQKEENKQSKISFKNRLLEINRTHSKELVDHLLRVKGLMPLLMKRRNGQSWSAQDKALLLEQLRSLSSISPYFLLLILPGSVVLLPAYAWWLDKRRKRRKNCPIEG